MYVLQRSGVIVLRLNRLKKIIIEKENNKKALTWFFIIIPIVSIALGYLISRIIILPIINK
jgi:hypothetical protein